MESIPDKGERWQCPKCLSFDLLLDLDVKVGGIPVNRYCESCKTYWDPTGKEIDKLKEKNW